MDKTNPSGGFAVIISLSLMAFIVLLLLSLTTLVRVETSSAEISTRQLEAKQQALLGLQIAIGELQNSMGPDQRVSATADIFDNSDATRKHAVGVWASADVSSASPSLERGDFIHWLVSDAKDSSGDPVPNYNESAPTNPEPKKLVKLVGAGSVNDVDDDGNDNDHVEVSMEDTEVEANGTTVGRYAWWVGDEGVKARVNLSRVSEESLSSPKQRKQRAVLEAGSPSIASPGILPDLDGIDFGQAAERIFSLGGIDLLPGGGTGVDKDYFHHLSAYPAGVLADVKNGGLKKDLSLAFEMDDSTFDNSEFGSNGANTINAPGFGGVEPIFTLDTTLGLANGPVWHLLRDYYRLYHEMENPMTNPTLEARVFGPNANHGNPNLRTPDGISGSGRRLDDQPALIMAGGKANFYHQRTSNEHSERVFGLNSGESNPSTVRLNRNLVGVEFYAKDSDAIRMGTVGDPLRGGGQSDNGTTMPVMVTGNYLPYMQRFISEMGVWVHPDPDAADGVHPNRIIALTENGTRGGITLTDPIALALAVRERFILHNPYNVTLNHNEIAIDAFGLETGFYVTDGGNNPVDIFIVPNDVSENSSRHPMSFERHSERQARIRADSFAPGQIKTFTAGAYGGGSRNSAYADEGVNPNWHDPMRRGSRADGSGVDTKRIDNIGYIERPTGAPYTAYVFGTYTIGDIAAARSPLDSRDQVKYTTMMATFTTHLKQDGNVPFDGHGMWDRWPMASAIDTSILLPGPDARVQNQSFGNYFPSGDHRFFNSTANSFVIDDQFLDDYTGSNNYNRQQNPREVMVVDLQLKAADHSATDTRYPAFAYTNPLAPVRDSKNLLPADDYIGDHLAGFPTLSPDLDITMDRTLFGGGLIDTSNRWGPSNDRSAAPNPVMIELPTAPVLSLGKLQHANISVHAHMPALAIGNSLASPYIEPGETHAIFKNRYESDRVFYDLSYLMNEALWDSYFFSGYSVPYNAGADDYDPDNSPSISFDQAFNAEATGLTPQPLPNPRMQLATSAVETFDDVREKLFAGTTIRDDAPSRSAENLMVAGSFNVNSTSVQAWESILAGARESVIYRSGGENSLVEARAGETPLPRFSQPVEGEWDGSDGSDSAWGGFRSLSDAQIRELATEIVSEIKARTANRPQSHPYLSLADFVNRELSAGAEGRMGLLQTAIEKAGLNEAFDSGIAEITRDSLDNLDTGAFPYPDNILSASDSPSATANRSAPTYLLQGDILQAIGSFISVRSDTFRIRSYGESLNPSTNEVVSKVWLEAVVQRTPNPVRPKPGTEPDDLEYWDGLDGNDDPDPLGRRFKIISIRELSQDEV